MQETLGSVSLDGEHCLSYINSGLKQVERHMFMKAKRSHSIQYSEGVKSYFSQDIEYSSLWHDWVTSLCLFTFMSWRRKWQPTPVFLPGESQGRGTLGAAVYGVAQSQTRLKWLSSSSSYIVGPCLTILNVVICIYPSQTPSPSISLPPSPWQP